MKDSNQFACVCPATHVDRLRSICERLDSLYEKTVIIRKRTAAPFPVKDEVEASAAVDFDSISGLLTGVERSLRNITAITEEIERLQ